jgi:hypothetical protein
MRVVANVSDRLCFTPCTLPNMWPAQRFARESRVGNCHLSIIRMCKGTPV